MPKIDTLCEEHVRKFCERVGGRLRGWGGGGVFILFFSVAE